VGNEGLDDVIRIDGASSPQSHNVLLVSLEYPWSVGIALPRIRGDFNSKDERGRVPLDTPESEKDIAELGADAWDGLHVLIYDEGGYQADGILEFVDGIWRLALSGAPAGDWQRTSRLSFHAVRERAHLMSGHDGNKAGLRREHLRDRGPN